VAHSIGEGPSGRPFGTAGDVRKGLSLVGIEEVADNVANKRWGLGSGFGADWKLRQKVSEEESCLEVPLGNGSSRFVGVRGVVLKTRQNHVLAEHGGVRGMVDQIRVSGGIVDRDGVAHVCLNAIGIVRLDPSRWT